MPWEIAGEKRTRSESGEMAESAAVGFVAFWGRSDGRVRSKAPESRNVLMVSRKKEKPSMRNAVAMMKDLN